MCLCWVPWVPDLCSSCWVSQKVKNQLQKVTLLKFLMYYCTPDDQTMSSATSLVELRSLKNPTTLFLMMVAHPNNGGHM